MTDDWADAFESVIAFNRAIEAGRLSTLESSPIWAGHFMFMGTLDGVDQFKHRDTREYLP